MNYQVVIPCEGPSGDNDCDSDQRCAGCIGDRTRTVLVAVVRPERYEAEAEDHPWNEGYRGGGAGEREEILQWWGEALQDLVMAGTQTYATLCQIDQNAIEEWGDDWPGVSNLYPPNEMEST